MKIWIRLLLFMSLTLAAGCTPTAQPQEYDAVVVCMADGEIYALNMKSEYESGTVCRADGSSLAYGEKFLFDTGGAAVVAVSALDAEGRQLCTETFEREPRETLTVRLIWEERDGLRFIRVGEGEPAEQEPVC